MTVVTTISDTSSSPTTTTTTPTTTPTTSEIEEELSDAERQDQAEAEAIAASAEATVSYPAHIERNQQRKLRARTRRALDERKLCWCCMADSEEFSRYGTRVQCQTKHYDDFYFYQDNGSDILAVAHLDSVAELQRFFRVEDHPEHGDIIRSPSLDDRLGAYVITELLPKLGVKADILLTTGEESGQSTAQFFKTEKNYNWMFQFDRMGTDVVMYQYDTPQRRELLRSVNALPMRGAFSDISDLGHLGCAGFNWGVGYHDYHSTRAWASIDQLVLQVGRFARFYQRYKGIHMAHIGSGRWRDDLAGGYWGGWTNPVYSPYEGTGTSTVIKPARVIPDIDEQLQGAKRGSGRVKQCKIKPRRLVEPSAQCPICNSVLEIDNFCDYCGWDAAQNAYTDHILGMTEEEYRRYEGRAEQSA